MIEQQTAIQNQTTTFPGEDAEKTIVPVEELYDELNPDDAELPSFR